MSVPSDKSTISDLSERLSRNQLDDNLNGNSVNSKLFDDETYPFDTFEYGGNHEDYGGEFEVYTNKMEQKEYERSISILEEEAYPENELTAVEAGKCLSRIGEVGSGLMYAFTQIDIDHRNLTNIEEVANFKYLSIINVSYNHLDLNALDALRGLEYVVEIQADHNVVQSLCLSSMAYLQVLTLNSNRVSSLSGLKQPSLECLELNNNKISSLIQKPSENVDANYCNEIDCSNLSTLVLSRNALETVEEFMILSFKLRILYLSYNKIGNLNGIEYLSNLSRLHLRANRVSNLDGFTDNLKNLTYLNLRQNRLHDVNELTKLICLKSLKTLVVSDNEFSKKPNVLKSKVIKMLPWLERIDKDMVSVFKLQVISDDSDADLEQENEEEFYEDD